MLTRWTWEHMSTSFSYLSAGHDMDSRLVLRASAPLTCAPPHLVQKLLPLLVEYLIKYLSSYLMLIVYW